MFCIPYSDTLKILCKSENGQQEHELKADKQVALAAAMALAEKWGSALYDIQLLPYCPIPECIREDGVFDVRSRTPGYIYKKVENADYPALSTLYYRGVIVFCSYSSFTFDIKHSVQITEPKIQNQTDMWRLCSPNYGGIFEFNAVKNKGVSYFNVDCQYKPHNPYIHINPNFDGLYGTDFNDSRGLICGGDFSLPSATNAWNEYELQNKNYQQIFDRQIDNMEINNRYQKQQEVLGAITGTLTGIAAGAGAGAKLGSGPAGAVVGSIIGGGITGVAGIMETQINDALRAEAIDYTKDLFGYELGNIKARPNSLAKTSAFSPNNKIFPFIEYYSCTEEEKEAFRNKLKYNGMTVMRIGKIEDYIQPKNPSYIKGQIIRIENNPNLEFHEAREISNEIYKGVFI